jgi:hypothetical protein
MTVHTITGEASFVIPATDTAPALRVYLCGCTYRHDGGWCHCNEHTNTHGIRTAATISAKAAKEAASQNAEALAIFDQAWRDAMIADGTLEER